jgi:hypothetical protein
LLKTRMLGASLFASLLMATHCVVYAQEQLPEGPSAVQLASSASVADSPHHTDADGIRPASPASPLPPAQEIAVEGFVSYGHWQIFAAGHSEFLYTAGMEYDRNSWGNFLGAQMDYAAEVLPFVLLREPRVLDKWGNQKSKDYVTLHGLGFSPIGLRMLWRPDKAFKPYFTVKGGAVAFTQKALSPDASYYAFSLSETIGFYTRLSDRWDMRVGLFGDYHFSNAYITSYNPGLDVMNSSIAFNYHLGSSRTTR